VNNNDKEI